MKTVEFRWRGWVAAATWLAVAACSGSPDEAADAEPGVVASSDTSAVVDAPPPAFPDPAMPDPPPMVVESISIEGNIEEIEARRFAAPAGFPLQFTTVIPADMAIEQLSSGEGDAIHVTAEFGGVPEPDAIFVLMVLPEGSDEAAARRMVEALGVTPEPNRQGGWQLEEFDLEDTPGFVALGERNGRWFYLLARYPPEYGDGMGPRLDLILRRWRWADGTPLMGAG